MINVASNFEVRGEFSIKKLHFLAIFLKKNNSTLRCGCESFANYSYLLIRFCYGGRQPPFAFILGIVGGGRNSVGNRPGSDRTRNPIVPRPVACRNRGASGPATGGYDFIQFRSDSDQNSAGIPSASVFLGSPIHCVIVPAPTTINFSEITVKRDRH